MERPVNLRSILKKKNIRQIDLARHLGVTQRAVCGWVGRNSIPKPYLLRAAARLDVSLVDLAVLEGKRQDTGTER